MRTEPLKMGPSGCLTPQSLGPVVRKSRDLILFWVWQVSRARRHQYSVSEMLSHHALALFLLSELAATAGLSSGAKYRVISPKPLLERRCVRLMHLRSHSLEL